MQNLFAQKDFLFFVLNFFLLLPQINIHMYIQYQVLTPSSPNCLIGFSNSDTVLLLKAVDISMSSGGSSANCSMFLFCFYREKIQITLGGLEALLSGSKIPMKIAGCE